MTDFNECLFHTYFNVPSNFRPSHIPPIEGFGIRPSLPPNTPFEFDLYYGTQSTHRLEANLERLAGIQAPIWSRLEKGGEPLTEQERAIIFKNPDYGMMLKLLRKRIASVLPHNTAPSSETTNENIPPPSNSLVQPFPLTATANSVSNWDYDMLQ